MANIVETAEASGFTTLVAALKATGLDKTLSGSDSYTVFAPTDAAFAKVDVAALLKDIPTLTNILLFHTVQGGAARPTRNGRSFTTLFDDKEISVKVTVDTVDSYIWGGQETPALVEKLDVKCDNGLIHIISEVLIPYEGTVAPVHN
jgi:transforming growth factor-beta-induced protein